MEKIVNSHRESGGPVSIWRTEMRKPITGVELTQVPRLQVSAALVLFGELGPDLVRTTGLRADG